MQKQLVPLGSGCSMKGQSDDSYYCEGTATCNAKKCVGSHTDVIIRFNIKCIYKSRPRVRTWLKYNEREVFTNIRIMTTKYI
jgi:hypothetical protein